MKSFLKYLLLALSITPLGLLGSNPIKVENRLVDFIIQWGYLENHHPLLLSNCIHIDSMFCSLATQIINSNSSYSRQDLLKYLNSELIEYEIRYNVKISRSNEILTTTKNYSQGCFPDSLNYNKRVTFNESTYNLTFKSKLYRYAPFPDAPWRVLAVEKIWNNYRFFYPYQEVLPNKNKYRQILLRYVKKVLICNEPTQYHLAICQLISEYKDSHSAASSSIIANYFGSRLPPIKVSFIQERLVVTGFYSRPLFDISELKIGDIIVKIKNEKTNDSFKRLEPFIAYSNSASRDRDLSNQSILTNDNFLKLGVIRNKKYIEFLVKTYSEKELFALDKAEKSNYSLQKLNDTTLYIGFKYLDTANFRNILEKDRNLRYFIFDIRSSSKWIRPIIEDFFIKNKTTFCMYSLPQPLIPGIFSNLKPLSIEPRKKNYTIENPKVYILVNENTQSQGEFQTMFLQAIPNSITIGSQSAGTDGNTSVYDVPGGIKITMTGVRLEYPNGRRTQNLGVKINHHIFPDIKSINKGIDKCLDFALLKIKNGN